MMRLRKARSLIGKWVQTKDGDIGVLLSVHKGMTWPPVHYARIDLMDFSADHWMQTILETPVRNISKTIDFDNGEIR